MGEVAPLMVEAVKVTVAPEHTVDGLAEALTEGVGFTAIVTVFVEVPVQALLLITETV
jgi:hypothetical protein